MAGRSYLAIIVNFIKPISYRHPDHVRKIIHGQAGRPFPHRYQNHKPSPDSNRLVLGRFEVASQVHADLVLVSQQGLEHLVGGHPDTSKRWALELAAELEDLLVEFFDFLVVLEHLGLDVVSEIVSLVNLGVNLTAELLELFVVHARHVGQWQDSLGEDLLFAGGLALGLLAQLLFGLVEQQALELHFALRGHLLFRHDRGRTVITG